MTQPEHEADSTGAARAVSGTRRNAAASEARREQITEVVLNRGLVPPAELAKEFQISLATVHRDLDELQARGVLRKARGGVTAQPSGVFESTVGYRRNAMSAEKQAIARHALRYVEPGMSIILDDSTTALYMLEGLAAKAPLTVATNFLEALRPLSQQNGVTLLALGGDYDPLHDAFIGVLCLDHIQRLRVDAVFLATSAVSDGYAWHQEDRIVSVKRAMLAAASHRYLLTDHSKLERTALHQLAAVSDFTAVIVDSGTSSKQLADLRRHHATVEKAAAR